MPDNNHNGRKYCKYLWIPTTYELWCKNQCEKIREIGINITPAGITQLLLDRVIVPSNIDISKIISLDTIKVKIEAKK